MDFIRTERDKLERTQRGVMGIQRIIEEEGIQATMEEIQVCGCVGGGGGD